MNWYYADAGQQLGPFDDNAWQELVRKGTVRPDTLVWQEGMAEWQPFRNVGGAPAVPLAAPGAWLDLRPMDIGDILDRTFRLYRAHFLTFFLIMLTVQAIQYLVQLGLQLAFLQDMMSVRRTGPQFLPFGYLGGLMVTVFLGVVMTQIAIGTLTQAVSEAYLGRQLGIGAAYLSVRPKLGKLFGATILSGLLVMLGMILCIIPGIYLMLSYLLTSEVVVIEGLGAREALRRSKELMRVKSDKGFLRNNITKASIILLITFILVSVVSAVVNIPFTIVYAINAHSRQMFNVFSPVHIAHGVLNAVVQAAAMPIGTIAMILFYYDIRIRKEGFDLQVLASSLGAGTPAV